MNDELSLRQRQAAHTSKQHVITFAAAGTGKTSTMIGRTIHLLDKSGSKHVNILMLAFGNDAICEINKRLTRAGINTENVTVNTIHSFASSILRKHYKLIGFTKNFNIAQESDVLNLLKQIITKNGSKVSKKKLEGIYKKIEIHKNSGRFPEQIKTDTESRAEVFELYKALQHRLKAMNLVTYSDLILHAITLLKEHKIAQNDYIEAYHHILVDEFQDINPAQYKLITLLAGKTSNLWVVGDDDQSIYSWRVSYTNIMQRFSDSYPNAKPFILENNHRSNGHIVIGSRKLIEKNENREWKDIQTTNPYGNRIRIRQLASEREEAEYIADNITILLENKKVKPSRIAILVRLKKHYGQITKVLEEYNIKYAIRKNKQNDENQTVTNALMYLRAVVSSKDELAIATILKNTQGVGKVSINKVHTHAVKHSLPFWRAALKLRKESKITKKALVNFIDDFQVWQNIAKKETAKDAAKRILKASGYMQSLSSAPDKLKSVRRLLSEMQGYSSISDFLQNMSLELYDKVKVDGDTVNIMTIYTAKGKEYNTVFLPAWEDGGFPYIKSLGKVDKVEEERRLAYVGITRAKKRAYITHIVKPRRCQPELKEPEPSRFIDELRGEHTKISRSKEAIKALSAIKRNDRKSTTITADAVVSHNENYGYGLVIKIKDEKALVKFNDVAARQWVKKTNLTKA